MGMRHSDALENAMFYLDSLKAKVQAAWQLGGESDAVLQIPIACCLKPELKASQYEELYHRRNLESIVDRHLLAVPC